MEEKKRLIIIGTGGQGKVAADIAERNGYRDIVFLTSDSSVKECSGYPVIGPDTMAPEVEGELFIAIGNGEARKRLMEANAGRTFPVLVHPAATVAKSAVIGPGTIVMAGAVISPYASVGQGCIVNTCSSVDHDCVLGDYVHISVGAHLAGKIRIGDMTRIGAGATVIDEIHICGGCVIGAGAVVVKNIEKAGTYVGIPAAEIN